MKMTMLRSHNEGALEYLAQQKLPQPLQAALNHQPVAIDNQKEWDPWLTAQGIKRSRHRKSVTEGALMGGLLAQGIPSDRMSCSASWTSPGFPFTTTSVNEISGIT